MFATQIYRRLDRSLVLVPSYALRRQIAKKPEDRRDVNRSRDAFGGDCSDCGCRHGGYAASGAAGIAGSDCIHDAGELRFWSVGWMYQDHFLQADFTGRICRSQITFPSLSLQGAHGLAATPGSCVILVIRWERPASPPTRESCSFDLRDLFEPRSRAGLQVPHLIRRQQNDVVNG
jgi:hypothetical protein